MSFVPGTDRWQHFPVISLDPNIQAKRDAATLADYIASIGNSYGIEPERMGRALTALAEQWAAWLTTRANR